MNWAAMTAPELRNYAPLYATTDLEKALLARVELDAQLDRDLDESHQEASSAWEAQTAAEAKLESLKDELFAILNDEEGDDTHLIGRVREVLEGA